MKEFSCTFIDSSAMTDSAYWSRSVQIPADVVWIKAGACRFGANNTDYIMTGGGVATQASNLMATSTQDDHYLP